MQELDSKGKSCAPPVRTPPEEQETAGQQNEGSRIQLTQAMDTPAGKPPATTERPASSDWYVIQVAWWTEMADAKQRDSA